MVTKAVHTHWDHADAGMICPSLKEPLDITGGLDVVVGRVAHFLLFHWSLTKLYLCLFDLILYVPVNNFSIMCWDRSS